MSFFDGSLHQKMNNCLGNFDTMKDWIISKKPDADLSHQVILYGCDLCSTKSLPPLPPPISAKNSTPNSTKKSTPNSTKNPTPNSTKKPAPNFIKKTTPNSTAALAKKASTPINKEQLKKATEKICQDELKELTKLKDKIKEDKLNRDKKSASSSTLLPKISVDQVVQNLTVSPKVIANNSTPSRLSADPEPNTNAKSIVNNFKKMAFPSLITPVKDDPFGSEESTVIVEKDCTKFRTLSDVVESPPVLTFDVEPTNVVVDICKPLKPVPVRRFNVIKNMETKKKLSKIDAALEKLKNYSSKVFIPEKIKLEEEKVKIAVKDKGKIKLEEHKVKLLDESKVKIEKDIVSNDTKPQNEQRSASSKPKIARNIAPKVEAVYLPQLEYVNGAPRLICRVPLTLLPHFLPKKSNDIDTNQHLPVVGTKSLPLSENARNVLPSLSLNDINKVPITAENKPLFSLLNARYLQSTVSLNDVSKISPIAENKSLGSSSNAKDISSSSSNDEDRLNLSLNNLITDCIDNQSYDMPIFDFGSSSVFIDTPPSNNSDNENHMGTDTSTSTPIAVNKNVFDRKEDIQKERQNLKRMISSDDDLQNDKRQKLEYDEMNTKLFSIAPSQSFTFDQNVVDGNCYMVMASKLLRSSPDQDTMTRLIERLESAVYCYLSGYLVEKQLGRPYMIYKSAIDKLNSSSNVSSEENQTKKDPYFRFFDRKLQFFSSCLQALLSFRLYAPFQKSVQRNFEYFYEFNIIRKNELNAPGKVDSGGVGGNAQRYEIAIDGCPFVAIPPHLEIMYKKQINRIHSLALSHRCWEQAENQRNPQDSEFYVQMDRLCGRLSLMMDPISACVYLLTALNWLKAFHEINRKLFH